MRTRSEVAHRHAEIAMLEAYGLTRKQIALAVGVVQWTVRYHLVGDCGCGRPYGQRLAKVIAGG